MISFLILINFANHFTESTFKQFISEKQRFNPNFERAFEIIENSQIKISVADFKQLFSLAQLNRGWTKPQLEDFKARLKDG